MKIRFEKMHWYLICFKLCNNRKVIDAFIIKGLQMPAKLQVYEHDCTYLSVTFFKFKVGIEF